MTTVSAYPAPAAARTIEPAAHPVRTGRAESLRRRVLRSATGPMYWSGLAAAYGRVAVPQCAVILTYHSVLAPGEERWIDPCNAITASEFEAQARFLAQRRRVVGLSQLVDDLEAGRDIPRGTVVITFDDGYLDVLNVAAPILEKYGLPATLFVPTGYIARGETQWIDRLYTAFRYRTSHALSLAELGPRPLDLANGHLREAYGSLNLAMIGASRAGRDALLGQVAEQLRPATAPPRLTMNWNDVRTLRERHPSFEIGVHSVDHTDLSACSPEQAAAEVLESIAQAERELGRRPEHFSFPYDRDTPGARAEVVKAGLRSCAGSGDQMLVRPGADRYALPRFETTPSLTGLRFVTSGACPGLPRLLFRRA